MNARTAIFDFDGTIADSFEAVLGVLNSLASEFGYRVADADEVQELRTLPLREAAARVGVAWHQLPFLAPRVRKEMVKWMPSVRPCPGVPEALAHLRGSGLAVGLLTSNSRENVDLFLAQHPMALDFISTGSGLFSKHRRLASVMRRRGLAAADVAYVGDEVRDIEAGRALGLRVVSVGWGYTAPELLRAHHPDHLVLQPDELLQALS